MTHFHASSCKVWPSQQKKLIFGLVKELAAEDAQCTVTTENWWEYRLCSNGSSIIYLLFHFRTGTKCHPFDFRQAVRRLIKRLVEEDLHGTQTGYHHDLWYNDPMHWASLTVDSDDWEDFSEAFRAAMTPEFLGEYSVDDYLFYMRRHGLKERKMDLGDIIFSANLSSARDQFTRLCQIHVATEITPRNGEACFVSYGRARAAVPDRDKLFCFPHYFLRNLGAVSYWGYFLDPSLISFQCYSKATHLIKIGGYGSFLGFFILGLTNGVKLIKSYAKLMRMRNTVVKFLAGIRGAYEVMRNGCPLRIEEVRSRKTIYAAVTEARALQRGVVPSAQALIEQGCIAVVKEGWRRHLDANLRDDLDFFDDLITVSQLGGGSSFLNASLITQIHSRENRIRFFMHGGFNWRQMDYRHIKELIAKGFVVFNESGALTSHDLEDEVQSKLFAEHVPSEYMSDTGIEWEQQDDETDSEGSATDVEENPYSDSEDDEDVRQEPKSEGVQNLDQEMQDLVPERDLNYRIPCANINVRYTYHGGAHIAAFIEWLVEVYYSIDSVPTDFDELYYKWLTVALSAARRWGGCNHAQACCDPEKSLALFNIVEYLQAYKRNHPECRARYEENDVLAPGDVLSDILKPSTMIGKLLRVCFPYKLDDYEKGRMTGFITSHVGAFPTFVFRGFSARFRWRRVFKWTSIADKPPPGTLITGRVRSAFNLKNFRPPPSTKK